MIKNELLGAQELDIGFSYPDDYVVFLSHMEEIDNTSWWLIGRSKGFFDVCFKVLNTDLGSKKLLIPFAKCDETNGVACFDSQLKIFFHSDEPSLAGVDWENRFSLPNFSVWLEWVKSGRL